MDGKLDMRQQCVLAAQISNSFLGCKRRSMASMPREVIVLLYSELVSSHLESGIQMWSTGDIDLLEVHPAKGHKNDLRDVTPS